MTARNRATPLVLHHHTGCPQAGVHTGYWLVPHILQRTASLLKNRIFCGTDFFNGRLGILLRPGEGRLELREVVQVHVAVAVGIEPARAEVLVPRDLVVME